MASIVIVHGGWGGGWEWSFVARELRQRGHVVFTVTLTGLGDRAHLAGAQVTLASHVQDVLAVLEMEDLSGVILCGHSYGGLVVSQVSGAAADRVAAALYLDALVPEVGESLFDLVGDELAGALRSVVRDGWAVPCPFRYVPDVDMPADLAEWYNSRSRPQPLRTFTDPVSVASGTSRCGYVSYLDSDNTQEPFLHRSAERARSQGWWMRTLVGIHDAHVTAPTAVAAVIDQFARAR